MCAGNVGVDQATRNVLGLLSFARRTTVRVHVGAHSAIINRPGTVPGWAGHGSDGLGGVGLSDEVPKPKNTAFFVMQGRTNHAALQYEDLFASTLDELLTKQ
jgi:inosine-uridine nucleoside N-ribohydrolase